MTQKDVVPHSVPFADQGMLFVMFSQMGGLTMWTPIAAIRGEFDPPKGVQVRPCLVPWLSRHTYKLTARIEDIPMVRWLIPSGGWHSRYIHV